MAFRLPDEAGVPRWPITSRQRATVSEPVVTRNGAMGTGSHLTPARARKFPVNVTCEAVRPASVEAPEPVERASN
jgi:hypothetical protein